MSPLQTQHRQDLERVSAARVGVRGGKVTPTLEFVPGRQQFQDQFGTRGGANRSPLLSDAVDTGGVTWEAGVRLSANNTALVFSPAQVGKSVLAGKRLALLGSEGWGVLWLTINKGVRLDDGNWIYTGRNKATASWRVLNAADYEETGAEIVPIGTDGVLETTGGLPTKIQYGRPMAVYARVGGRMTLEPFGGGYYINASETFSPYGGIFFL